LAFDDFKDNAFDNCSEFRKSRKFRALIRALRDGLRCVVADIDFCKEESRAEAVTVLLAEVPGVKLDWRFFKNDPSACEANIKSRNRPSLPDELKNLQRYSEFYDIPQGAVVLPVVQNSQT